MQHTKLKQRKEGYEVTERNFSGTQLELSGI